MNAREELLRVINEANRRCGKSLKPRCAYIYRESSWSEPHHYSILYTDHTPTEWEVFLKSLDYDYDCGYGLQEVYGTLWFADGTWLEREEYDGSENWVWRTQPPIPEECFRPVDLS